MQSHIIATISEAMMDDFRYPPTDPRRTQWIIEATIGAMVVGILFGVIDIAYGLWFELRVMPSLRVPNAPMLSYGQEAAVMWFLLMGLGATVGTAVGVARRFNLVIAATLPTIAATLLAAIVSSLWIDSNERYGYDPSEWIVYVPTLVVAVVVLVLAMIVGAIGGVRLLLQVGPSPQPSPRSTEERE